MLKDLHGRLRPMGFSDILDETIEIYKSNFILLIGVTGAIFVPYAVIIGLLQPPQSGGNELSPTLLINFVFSFIISSVITGALTFAISERYLGREATIGGSYRRVFSPEVLWRFAGAASLKTLMVFGPILPPMLVVIGASAAVASDPSPSMTALAVVGAAGLMILAMLPLVMFLATKLAFVEPAVLLEHYGIWASIKRSWGLVAGFSWQLFGLMLVVVIIVSVVSGLIAGPTSVMITMRNLKHLPVGSGIYAAHMTLFGIAHMLTTPVISIAIILFYYNMRIRKEGFDLQLLAMELDAKSQGSAAGGASALPQEAPDLIPHGQPDEAVSPQPPAENEEPQ